MMIMKRNKRIHRVAISLDDETFQLLSHLANYDHKDLSTYIGHMVEEKVHGLRMKLPVDESRGYENRCDTE